MARQCEGRVAIVTGAGRGLGREYALMLGSHGAKVVVNDLGVNVDGTRADAGPASEVAALINENGGQAVPNFDDVSSWSGAGKMIEQAVDTFGKLDVLVNNAGNLRESLLADMTEQDLDAIVQVHLKGTFASSHHAASYWRARHRQSNSPVGGRIINTTSTSGLFGSVSTAHYGAAKAGIAAFSIIAARELRPIGVTVNAISPSAMTRMTQSMQRTEAQKAAADPKWIAPVVTWLASEEAYDITERVFYIGNGIFSVMEGWHRGPQREPVLDPAEVGPIARELIAQARPNAVMDSWSPGKSDVAKS